MANVLKCSKCDVYEKDSSGDPVREYHHYFHLQSKGSLDDGAVAIKFYLPVEYHNTDLCGKCFKKLMLFYMPLIAEIFSPYAPGRVSGFNQGVVVEQDEKLTRAELTALKILGQRLLKAE